MSFNPSLKPSSDKTPSLEQVQSAFTDALRYQNDASTIGIISERFTADERVQIYRNNFTVSLSEVLLAIYPNTQLLVGEECFDAIAKHHIIHNPPISGDVTTYGKGFDQTIASLDNIISAEPYLADVALAEYRMDQLLSTGKPSISSYTLSLSELQNTPESIHPNIVLELKPSITLFQSKYAIASLFAALDSMSFEGLEINQAQCCVISIDDVTGKPIVSAVNSRLFTLINCLQQSQPLRQIDPTLLDLLPSLLVSDWIQGFKIDDPM